MIKAEKVFGCVSGINRAERDRLIDGALDLVKRVHKEENGPSLCSMLFVLLVGLKLSGAAAISWWAVCIPYAVQSSMQISQCIGMAIAFGYALEKVAQRREFQDELN